MKNLKELFVSKEIAIKLKEKGFDEPCMAVYRGGDLYFDKMISGYLSDLSENTELSKNTSFNNFDVNKNNSNYWITAPMLSQVMDWFEKQHKIMFCREAVWDSWNFVLRRENGDIIAMNPMGLNEAIEQALKLI